MGWSQLVIIIATGVTSVGSAQVLRALFSRRILHANADAQVVRNMTDIIDELKERNIEILQQWKIDVTELRTESDALRKQLKAEREAARIETERLYEQIAIKDREIWQLKARGGIS